MGTRVPLKGGDEYDTLTKHRRYFRYRPGWAKDLKRKFWKRVRKAWRLEAKEEPTNLYLGDVE